MNVEAALLDSLKRNDRKAQYDLYRRCYSFLMSVCLRYASDKDEAAVLLNEGFMKILINIKTYKTEIPFQFWIRRIMINTIIDNFRKNEKYRNMIELRDLREDMQDETESEINGAVRKMNLDLLNSFIKRLPNASGKVFNLFVIDGFNHAEISGMLNISEGTSKWHLSTARQKLMDMITDYDKKFKSKIA